MSAECGKCGSCCRAIWLPVSYCEMIERQVQRGRFVGTDVEFILRWWNPISETLAFVINPYLKTWVRKDDQPRGYYFECTRYDHAKKICTAHSERPPVCSNYPWYNDGPRSGFQFYSLKCAYRADLPTDQGHVIKQEQGRDKHVV